MKYPKPRILLVDMPSECGKELTNSGYNAKAGTFGVRYRVPPSDSLAHVSLNARSLPDYEEQEIIIVNTRDGGVSNRNSGNAPYGVSVFWQHAGRGIVDPRPPVMAGTSGAFDR